MEVVSTLNLGSSQTKKTTACNFQTMNSCVMSYDFMRGQIGSHANNKVFKTTSKFVYFTVEIEIYSELEIKRNRE